MTSEAANGGSETVHHTDQVVLFPTCLIDSMYPDVGLATAEIVERCGADVAVPDDATCCGQPAWNAGHGEEAAKVARTTLQALSETEGTIVIPSGSCATMITVFWSELFELFGDETDRAQVAAVVPRVAELSQYLDTATLPQGDLSQEPALVYHRSCHMLREMGIAEEPERVLDSYGADRRTTDSEGRCCGFGGLFAVKLPEVSVAMADEVLDALDASGASNVVGCDASCLMHLSGRAQKRGMNLDFEHLAQATARATEETP